MSQGLPVMSPALRDVAYETEREARESASSSEVLADLVAKQQRSPISRCRRTYG